MSRSRTRARNRRARLEKLGAEFEENRQDPEAFAALLRRLASSNDCVWGIARNAARVKPLDEAERAMIAQLVAPRLAGMTPGSVYRRHEFSGRTRPPTKIEEPELRVGRLKSHISGMSAETGD